MTKFSIYIEYPRHTRRIFETYDPKYKERKQSSTREYKQYQGYIFGEEDYDDDYDLGRSSCINPLSNFSQW